MNNKLAIIILQHNTPRDVNQNLKHLSSAILPKETEIIIINNGGKQANSKIKPFPNLNINLYESPNHGFPAGNNFGLSKLKYKPESYDYICFINPDIKVQPTTIQKLIEYMIKNPQVGLTSPTLKYPDGVTQDNYRVFPQMIDLIIKRIPILRKIFKKRMRNYLMWDRQTNSNQAVDWVVGAFTLISKKGMQAIQKHDESYFLFMSDIVICREIWENNLEVHIVGSTEALHDDERLSDGGIKNIFTNKLIQIHIKDSIKYFYKYFLTPLPKNSPSKKS